MKRYCIAIGVLSLPLLFVLALTRLLAQALPYETGGGPLQDQHQSALQAGEVITVCPASVGICPYADIQAAVDAAGDGDLIKVAAGTYTGVQSRPAPSGYPFPQPSGLITQVVYINKTITIRGGYTATNGFADPPDPAANPTTLDAQGQGRVLFIAGDISPIVEGLRITGGSAAGLGGHLSYEANAGGGVYIISATVTISSSQVFSNTATYGAGLSLYESDATLSNDIISANTGTNGGGLYLNYSAATLSGNTVSANRAASGGGLCLYGSDATLSGNTVTSNTGDLAGGGLYLYGSDAALSNNIISANTAWNCGGLCLGNSSATLSGNTVTSNTAQFQGGGLSLSYSDVTLINNVVARNWPDFAGSGLYIQAASPRLLHTTVADNSGGDGSGVYITNDGAIYSNVALTNTILISHTVGVYVSSGSTVQLESTLWYSNTDDWGGGGTIVHSNDHTGDPAFIGPDTGDYHIGLASAAIDKGMQTNVADDIDGEPRPQGGGYDIGADETGLVVTKQAKPDPVEPGSQLTYTIRITNTSNVTLHATITDTLPISVTISEASGNAVALPGGSQGITWTATITAPSGAWTETVVVTVQEDYEGPLVNTVEVTTEEGAAGNTSVTVNLYKLYMPVILQNYASPAYAPTRLGTSKDDRDLVEGVLGVIEVRLTL